MHTNNQQPPRLTQYSHGSGCGCKIAPAVLKKILASSSSDREFPGLVVGYSSNDDAAAYNLDDGRVLLSTTDFFTPIVDDPYDFGRIAATNALSDIYAMGGKPLMAVAILGWPVDKLSSEVANQVVSGGRSVCQAAGIPLAGGHSIDTPEPIFGLAVTGMIEKSHLKRNDSALPGCQLFLTKPLGIGILTTAQKQGKLTLNDQRAVLDTMTRLNQIGERLGCVQGVTAMTDVTGFGLLGHLLELCRGSNVSACIEYTSIPKLPRVFDYLAIGCSPGGTQRNFASYGHDVNLLNTEQQALLCDPQTSGGLLVAVVPEALEEFYAITRAELPTLCPIGETLTVADPLVEVI